MPKLDFNHLSQQDRLELIGELCDSLESDFVPRLTSGQEAELERRLATLEDDIKHGHNGDEILAEFRHLYG